jgi:phosphoacetylglucosamine mutase
MNLAYGTSGFRAHHSKIATISRKIGMAMALAVLTKCKSFGIMITASHNHHEDNGIKVLDEHGHMISLEMEDFIVTHVYGLAPHVCECTDAMTYQLYNSHIAIQIGYDSRKSSPDICERIVKGICSVHPQFPIVITPYITTPNLHFIFSEQGRQMKYLYYLRKALSLVHLPCILDCANGIGSKIMMELVESSSSISLINTNWEQHELLNHNCSSDFVCSYKMLPLPREIDAHLNPILRASLDGDADRVVFYYTKLGALHILNGDYIAALILTYLSKTVFESNVVMDEDTIDMPIAAYNGDFTIGFIYTGYTNSACVEYIKTLAFPPNIHVSCVCTATGVKHLHTEAEKYDIGVYFEQNGHGNVLFRKYPPRLEILAGLYHPNIGDGVLDLFATLYILQELNMSVQDWRKLYTEKHMRLSKIEVTDKNCFTSTENELELVEPAHVQGYIERICMAQKTPCRAFVRASGTENVVRLFVESDDPSLVETVHWKITAYIKRKMTDPVYHIKDTTFVLRHIKVQDLRDSYYRLLGQLSSIDVEKMDAERSSAMIRRLGDHHQIYVLEEMDSTIIVGSGTLLVEEKFIHNYGKVGHIEDIVVHSDYRGYGLGKIIIDHLTERARLAECYKCILDCSDINVGFYEKCGYIKKGAQMGCYY